jgi:hypothetical protein
MKQIYVIILLISFSCSEKKYNRNNCIEVKDTYTLERDVSKNIHFTLDSITSPYIRYLKTVNLNDTLFFTFLNPYNNSIYCFEYQTKKLYKKISLLNEKKLTGYDIVSWDSIYSYQKSDEKLSLHNNRGEILNEIIVPHKVQEYYAMPTTHAPLIYKDGYLYLVGGAKSNRKPEEITPVVAQINSNLSSINYLYHFPIIYTEVFFGGVYYNMDITYTYNQEEDLFIFNFPASHKIFTTKDFVSEKGYCAGSKFIPDIPEFNNGNEFQHCVESGFYYSLLYDKHNKLYYRVSLLPTEWDEIKQGSDRNLSIIILDKAFNKVGEKVFKNSVDFDLEGIQAIWVSPDGLLLRRKNNFNNESSVNFDVYKPIRKI